MNLIYTKTALYAYVHIEKVIKQIDDLVEKKALCSMNDFSPCLEQCEKIVNLTMQKEILIELKKILDKAMEKTTPYEKDCLDYRYFKKKQKEYYKDFDAESRKYFRKQASLNKKLSIKLDKLGATDQWFENKCLNIKFLSELQRHVVQREKFWAKKKREEKGVKRVA